MTRVYRSFAYPSFLRSGLVYGFGLSLALTACSDDRGNDSPDGILDSKDSKKPKKDEGDEPESDSGKEEKEPGVLPGGGSKGGKAKRDGPQEGGSEEPCDKIDFVFVIDDSRSMLADQLGMIGDFPNFIKVLNAYRTKDGEPLDYRIAVTSSSISYEITADSESFDGDDGLFRTTNRSRDGRSCWSGDRRWIERNDADLQERFSCAAEVGIDGLGHEMQMLALNMSLDDRVKSGDHEGFLRKDALLAAVILTDEDDCSTEDQSVESRNTCSSGAGSFPDTLMKQSRVLERLDAVKGNSRGRWALGVLSKYICIPDIVNGGVIPVEGPKQRLKGLVNQAGDNAVYVQVCDDKYGKHLKTVLDTFTEACENFPPPI